MRLKIIACEVMREELLAIAGREVNNSVDFEFVSLGLHLHPEKLNVELQRLLDTSKDYDKIILAFGLCGGGARGLKASGFTLIIPRVHDCIALLLGSRENYMALQQEELGTLYLSSGWMKGEKSILSEYERVRQKFGDKKATVIWKRIYDSYRRVLFIHTGGANEADCLLQSRSVARLLELSHQTTQGDSRFLARLVKGPWEGQDFIQIPPGGIVEEAFFLK